MRSAAIAQHQHSLRFGMLSVVLPIGLVLTLSVATALGPVWIDPATVWNIILSHVPVVGDLLADKTWSAAEYAIIWHVRLPRVLLGALTGAGLALAGAGIQALVRNSLADPYILGISAGASVGATLVLLSGAFGILGIYALPVAAFAGALFATVLVLSLAQVGGRIDVMRLLLSGVALSIVLGAATNLIVLAAPSAEQLRGAMFWLMGSLVGAKWEQLPVVAVVVAAAYGFLGLQARSLNLLLMGEETATTLGLNLHLFRRLVVVVASLLAGVLVAYTGGIGFVGLMIPHLARLFVGPDHRRLLPTSLLLGALFLVWADVAARLWFAP
ncbi:MAG: iron ABC transporter permease, partial [Salinisphaera sp.]|nr:iron ABC transporter permease [Salinisphaera sp.]